MLVVVAAFASSVEKIKGVRDSKALTAKKRQLLVPEIMRQAAYVGFGWASAAEIDSMGMNKAWQLACQMALYLMPPVSVLYVDGDTRVDEYEGKQEVIVRADSGVWQVSAASVVAKEARDLVMRDTSRLWPYYEWDKNAGYGTHKHQLAILEHGITWEHRKSFLKKLRARMGTKLKGWIEA